jgi:hypothetical protein
MGRPTFRDAVGFVMLLLTCVIGCKGNLTLLVLGDD